MVGGEAGEQQPLRAPGMAEPVALATSCRRRTGRRAPPSAARSARRTWHAGVDQRRDHHAVPVRQHLVVESGAHPLVAHREQPLRASDASRVSSSARRRHPREPVEDGVALEIALGRDVVVPREERGLVLADGVLDLVERPDVELALLAFASRRRARRRTRRSSGRHLAREPLDGFLRARLNSGLPERCMRQRQQLEELRIVVEHLLEMRHQPALVDRVAREAAAEMIVDAALADALERDARPPRSSVARRCAALPATEIRAASHCGNFGAPRMPPCTGSISPPSCCAALVELRRPDDDLALRRRGLRQPRHQRAAIVLDALRLLAEHARDFAQHVDEGRLAVAALLREIGAAPERLALRREEHGQRPAAVLAHQVQRRHVDLVDVGPLLAIDLDVDEQLVHHRRGGVVLEALVRHHVAPVAGGVADREQDRLVGALGLRQRRPGSTATSRPDCACAAGDRARSPARGGSGGLLLRSMSLSDNASNGRSFKRPPRHAMRGMP